jgi:hypothetical protein
MNQILEFLNYAAVNYHPVIFALIIILILILSFICLIPIGFLFAYIGNFLQQQFPVLRILFINLDKLDGYVYKQNFNRQSQPRRRHYLTPMDELEIKLLKLCRGDKELARSLYKEMKQNYPEKDKKWHLEAVINDLLFDRAHSRPEYTTQKQESQGFAGLWHQLLVKVNFDTEKAEKIIEDLRCKYPNKSDGWYIEKANCEITDLTLKTNSVLESEIFKLLQGDRELAIRLLKNAKERNPGQSYEWYLQKVIWDLERDRRI